MPRIKSSRIVAAALRWSAGQIIGAAVGSGILVVAVVIWGAISHFPVLIDVLIAIATAALVGCLWLFVRAERRQRFVVVDASKEEAMSEPGKKRKKAKGVVIKAKDQAVVTHKQSGGQAAHTIYSVGPQPR